MQNGRAAALGSPPVLGEVRFSPAGRADGSAQKTSMVKCIP